MQSEYLVRECREGETLQGKLDDCSCGSDAELTDPSQEGCENLIDFEEDEDYAVRSLIHYFYSGEYGFIQQEATTSAVPPPQVPTEALRRTSGAAEPNAKKRKLLAFGRIDVPFINLAHVNVYALADRLGLLDLKALAVRKFRGAAESQYLCSDFHLAIARAYQVAPPGTEGQALRLQAVKVTVDHLEDIVKHDVKGNFAEMMAENGPFARDVALYGHGKPVE